MVITGMLWLQIYYGLLLKEHLPRTQEKLKRACLEHHCEVRLKICGSVKYSRKIIFIERRS